MAQLSGRERCGVSVVPSGLFDVNQRGAGTSVGSFVAFRCKFCQYEEPGIGVGRGKAAFPFLALYRCNHCHTIASTWIHEAGNKKHVKQPQMNADQNLR